MKKPFQSPLLLPLILLSLKAHGGMAWVDTRTSNAYSANSTVVLTATNAAPGVTVDFQSDASGTFSPANGESRQISFQPTLAIAAGSTVNFSFDFSRQLGSTGTGTRAALQFRLASNDSIQVDTQMLGGDQTLQDYWGASSGPQTNHINHNVLEFQDTFLRDPNSVTDGSLFYGGGPTSAIMQGFLNPDTVRMTGGDDNPINSYDGDATGTTIPIDGDNITRFHIVGHNRRTTNFKFSSWNFEVTANEEIAAGTTFLWTFEGADLGPVNTVPEPSSAILLGLGGFALALRRRK